MQAAQTRGAAVREVVAVDGGDDGVVEAEDVDGAGESERLHEVDRVRACRR